MPFVPHTDAEIRDMLREIGADDINTLFDEIPAALRNVSLDDVPTAAAEMDVARIMHARAAANDDLVTFIGAGAYDHHIPAAVWEITTRGEFYSAYTPYQAEASQGTLQLLYEFQTMMAGLTGMDVSNASLYDGATSLAEACLMAVRANRRSKSGKILMPAAVHPRYRAVARTITGGQGLGFETIPYDAASGAVDHAALEKFAGTDVTAVVIPQPNFFGRLEDVDALTDFAHANGAFVIAVVNPMACALLKAPGRWGKEGADIVCGEGQPLGIPMSAGGPYYGLLCARQKYVRQMPGRIVGSTVDREGRTGYTLTLQAREQHIRRTKATSNICTNQGLMVTASTIHMAIVGAEGLRNAAAASHAQTEQLVSALEGAGARRAFSGPVYNESVLSLGRPAGPVLKALVAEGIAGGFDLATDYPELNEHILVCATEKRSNDDIARYAEALRRILNSDRQVLKPAAVR